MHLALVSDGPAAAERLAEELGQPDLFQRVAAVSGIEPIPSFLHSALCAMSLPVRRPSDENAPIIRKDGNYTLVINPKPVLQLVGVESRLVPIGVPFGSLPRLILIHIMTEAVRAQSRHVHLGKTFTEWMRRLGYQTISYGPRGSATLIREQLDRLLACEWMIRWDDMLADGAREFGLKEIKLTNEYVGTDRQDGSFLREIRMTEAFYDHLKDHAVPLNENAIGQLRDSPTALDLYTWLAYRLPRINAKRASQLSWAQLAVHFGNDGRNIRKFRQTIRDAWERQVSAVYPDAKVEFDTQAVKLHASPPPLHQKLVAIRRPSADAEGSLVPEPLVQLSNSKTSNSKMLDEILARVGNSQARVWFEKAKIVETEGGPVLMVGSAFQADYIRNTFSTQLEAAARACGHTAVLGVEHRIVKV
ncbi:hypothetical protein HUK83_03500 [Endobacter medicaginis]|uniref:Plasmid encoded RepA protein n=2 Tax=Endobacter medicaginis TaxID=1181271 RepID=A0A850NQC1_9PROT|nr:replication protein RepA [Endobacter medicaginis]NVN29405.1 hypothetical protein [Endobacter medicaginis]